MMKQYLIHLRDKQQTNFLREYGYIVHISRLSNIVVFEGESGCKKKLETHPNVYKVEEDRTFSLA